MSDIKVKKGTRIEPSAAAQQDKGKMGVGRPTPPQQEVEGQAAYTSWVVCPWDGAMNFCVLDTDIYLWFTCWSCGGAFKA